MEEGVNLGETEQEDMETAMNKDSTGMIKLAPKYATSSGKWDNEADLDDENEGYYIKKPVNVAVYLKSEIMMK